MTWHDLTAGPTSTRGSSAPYAAVYPGAISANRCRVSTDSAAKAPAAPSVGSARGAATVTARTVQLAAPALANLFWAQMLPDSAKPAARLALLTASEPDPRPDRAARMPQAATGPVHARLSASAWVLVSALPQQASRRPWAREARYPHCRPPAAPGAADTLSPNPAARLFPRPARRSGIAARGRPPISSWY